MRSQNILKSLTNYKIFQINQFSIKKNQIHLDEIHQNLRKRQKTSLSQKTSTLECTRNPKFVGKSASSHCSRLPSCLTQDLNLMQFKVIQSHEGVLHSFKKRLFLLFALELNLIHLMEKSRAAEKGWNGRLFYLFINDLSWKNNKTINMRLKNDYGRFLPDACISPLFAKSTLNWASLSNQFMAKLVHKNNISSLNEILITFF